ncbi:glycosyltransferase family 2 protein [Algoriphagus sp. CAU 1675]|uniref:glycosyltransferase family 2 protein n=1 Tax=Algoriphagus sp. CAU 1675 TaxID=3032597 RepID=UPI0023DCCD5A|nr:glycosyltransferase family 2 protein [Algoriphagus sp. CAU 1675]MDF2158505.1 glycosyltransferase family 2 protein [Algoriphagus sp. CAU 1675]
MAAICIIIPVYNEEEAIPGLLDAFIPYFKETTLEAQVLVVNDGSKDSSLDRIRELCRQDSRFHYISFESNRGLSSAIKAGFDEAKTDWVGYIDADLQTSPMDFLKFEPYLDSYDLVMGNRAANRKDTLMKRFSSRFANWFRDSLLHDGVHDSGCPLKILRRDLAVSLPFFVGMHRFIPALVLMKGGKLIEIQVSHFPRTTGKSKFNLWNRLLSPLMDTLAVRWMMKRNISYRIESSDNPLHNQEQS